MYRGPASRFCTSAYDFAALLASEARDSIAKRCVNVGKSSAKCYTQKLVVTLGTCCILRSFSLLCRAKQLEALSSSDAG